MNLSLSRFEDMVLYSNKNIEKLAASVIAESSNAVLAAMYEDGAILLDHKEGQFYMCEYAFDIEKATISFSNFDPINLIRENTSFKDTVYNYFENEEAETSSLLEDFKMTVMEQDKFITELINEAMVSKDFGNEIDYTELAELNEHSLDNEKFFVEYKNRLASHPLTEAKLFNWKDPVVVSLVESERVGIVNSSAKEKAQNLWKVEGFKERFIDASKAFVEDVEDGIAQYTALLEEYPQVFTLDGAERKTLFGKMLIADAELREMRNDILKGFDLMLEQEDSVKIIKEAYLSEGAFEDGESMDFTDDDGNTKPTRKEKDEMFKDGKRDEKEEEDKPLELSEEELDKIAKELEKLSKEVKGEALKEKLEKLAEKLHKGKQEGTHVKTVKEAVELLSF